MKKINYLMNSLLVAFIAITVATSCSKDIDEFENVLPVEQQSEPAGSNNDDEELIDMEFGASAGGSSSTRSVLTESNEVEWISGDKITVFDGTAGREFVTSSSGQYVKFSGKAKRSSVYYALYPYQPTATMENGIIRNVTLPSAQKAVAGSFPNNISVACSSDMNLYFNNIVSLVKLSIGSDNASDVCKVTLNTDAALTGNVDIAFDENCVPYISGIKQESNSVSLELQDGFTKDDVYYIAVLPTSFNGKISVTFESKDGKECTKEFSGNVDMDRSRIFNIGEVNVDFVEDPGAENEPFAEFGCAIAIPEGVDLGLPSGNIWSEFYLGASTESGYGILVGMGDPTGTATAFNDPEPYFHSNDVPSICGSEYDVITNLWGSEWQLPTLADLNELKEQCTWEHNVEMDGVRGSLATGPNGNKLFFAYAGIRAGDSYTDQGDHASIWAGEVGGVWNSGYPGYYDMDIFHNGRFNLDGSTCWTGQSARGVKKTATAK